jgi:hypothetical protein
MLVGLDGRLLTERPPDPPGVLAGWQAELDKITDPSDSNLTSLRLVWIAGYPWQPIERYMIYQMWPTGKLPFGVEIEELRGGDPSEVGGHYDSVLGEWVPYREMTIDHFQWRLFRETGRYGVPYWVVQGDNGGHQRRYTTVQRSLAKAEGGLVDLPAPGDLPFARPDRRTFEALRGLDMLMDYEGMIAFDLRSPEMIAVENRERVRKMRQKMWTFMMKRQEEAWDGQRTLLRKIRDAAPVGVGQGTPLDKESIERRFIESR